MCDRCMLIHGKLFVFEPSLKKEFTNKLLIVNFLILISQCPQTMNRKREMATTSETNKLMTTKDTFN